MSTNIPEQPTGNSYVAVSVLYMSRADFWPRADFCPRATSDQERTHSMSTVSFGFNFGLVILENPGIDLSLHITLKLFLESFYTWMKVCSWSKSHTFQSAFHMLNVEHLNTDGPLFPVKCVGKFRSTLGGEVTYKCVCVVYCLVTRHHKITKCEPFAFMPEWCEKITAIWMRHRHAT